MCLFLFGKKYGQLCKKKRTYVCSCLMQSTILDMCFLCKLLKRGKRTTIVFFSIYFFGHICWKLNTSINTFILT